MIAPAVQCSQSQRRRTPPAAKSCFTPNNPELRARNRRRANSFVAGHLQKPLCQACDTPNGLGNPFAHQGLAYDAEIGSYQNRHRQYAPKLKRFMQRDPLTVHQRAGLGYRDGLLLYSYVGGNPVRSLDPSGDIVKAGGDASYSCRSMVDLINSLCPPASHDPGFYCHCGQIKEHSGPSAGSCPLADLLSRMINDPNHTYVLKPTRGPKNECACAFCNLPRGSDLSFIYLPTRALDLFAEVADSDKPTKGEVIAHELAEAECRAAGGEPQACHDREATDAQNAQREAMGQEPTTGPNTSNQGGWVIHLPDGDWCYTEPWGPFSPCQ